MPRSVAFRRRSSTTSRLSQLTIDLLIPAGGGEGDASEYVDIESSTSASTLQRSSTIPSIPQDPSPAPCPEPQSLNYTFYAVTDLHGRSLAKLIPSPTAESDLSQTYLCACTYFCLPNPSRMEVGKNDDFGNSPVVPDPSTLTVWRNNTRKVICEMNADVCPRSICRRILEGFEYKHLAQVYSAFEYEFFLLDSSRAPLFDVLDIYSVHRLSTSPGLLAYTKKICEVTYNCV